VFEDYYEKKKTIKRFKEKDRCMEDNSMNSEVIKLEVIKEELNIIRLWITMFYGAFLTGTFLYFQNPVAKGVIWGFLTLVFGFVAILLYICPHKMKIKDLKEMAE